MSIFKQKTQTRTLQSEVKRVCTAMSKLEPDSKEYAAMAKNLETLYSAKGKEKDRRVSLDTLVVVIGSIVQICLIIGAEQTSVLTSKAMSFVNKGRV